MHKIADCFPKVWYEIARHILNGSGRPRFMKDKHEFKDGEWAWTPQDGWKKLEKIGNQYKHGRFLYNEYGYWNSNDEAPTLFTVERAELLGEKCPKRIVHKSKTVFLNVYKDSVEGYNSDTEAMTHCTVHALATAYPVQVDYEVEE